MMHDVLSLVDLIADEQDGDLGLIITDSNVSQGCGSSQSIGC